MSSQSAGGRRNHHRLLATLLAAPVLMIAACSSGAATSAPSSAAATPAPSSAATLTVDDAWARPSMGMDRAGAAYLVIHNPTGVDDALIGVSSPAAATVELHETSADASGMMAMHPVERIAIPAGGSAELKPGGYHIMLIGLTAPLVVGSKIELTLKFQTAAPITVQAEVKQG